MTRDTADTFTKAEVFVNEIVFYSKEEISLLGFLHDGGQFHETEYVISRNHLKMLLSANKKAGIEILWRVEEMFLQPHQVPVGLNLVELFGTTQVFDAQEIVLEIPAHEELDALTPKQQGMLFVNTVIPFANNRKNSF